MMDTRHLHGGVVRLPLLFVDNNIVESDKDVLLEYG
jgi:hypothetical protein